MAQSGPCTDTRYPLQETMFASGTNTPVPDLVLCTNGSSSWIENTSDNVVWYAPNASFWTASDDAIQPPVVQFFRAGLRSAFADIGETPYRTIEPHVWLVLAEDPSHVYLRTDAQEQSAWRTAALMVAASNALADQLQEKEEDALKELLAGDSKTKLAMITCVSDGWEIGKSFGSTSSQTEDPSTLLGSQLFDAGLNVNDCGDAISKAQEEDTASHVQVGVTLDTARAAEHESTWVRLTDSGLGEDVIRGLAEVIAHK